MNSKYCLNHLEYLFIFNLLDLINNISPTFCN